MPQAGRLLTEAAQGFGEHHLLTRAEARAVLPHVLEQLEDPTAWIWPYRGQPAERPLQLAQLQKLVYGVLQVYRQMGLRGQPRWHEAQHDHHRQE